MRIFDFILSSIYWHLCKVNDFHQVGLPAKSGVSGALVVVVPNVMGIGLWSPALDEIGNSVRGLQFCQVGISNYQDKPPYAVEVHKIRFYTVLLAAGLQPSVCLIA